MMKGKILVIAVGNPIRQDDGIGPYCLSLLEAALKGKEKKPVDFLTVHQLDILHCELFARYTVLILIDAEGRTGNSDIKLEEVLPQPLSNNFTSHIGSIGDLLALTEKLHGAKPRAYLMAVKGSSFDIGEGLSQEALDNASKAVEIIKKLIDESFPSY